MCYTVLHRVMREKEKNTCNLDTPLRICMYTIHLKSKGKKWNPDEYVFD